MIWDKTGRLLYNKEIKLIFKTNLYYNDNNGVGLKPGIIAVFRRYGIRVFLSPGNVLQIRKKC